MADNKYDITIFANTTVGRALQNQCGNVPSVMLGALWYEGGMALYGVYATILLVVRGTIHIQRLPPAQIVSSSTTLSHHCAYIAAHRALPGAPPPPPTTIIPTIIMAIHGMTPYPRPAMLPRGAIHTPSRHCCIVSQTDCTHAASSSQVPCVQGKTESKTLSSRWVSEFRVPSRTRPLPTFRASRSV